ncbi:MAG: hypothetical protein FJX57_18510, partial [Alphaproteobacteria bacterium]|nr:hypothetical protein [Alphaproteobacteria bacterium]
MVSPENRLQFLRPATRPRRDRGVLAVGTAILVAVWLSLVHASWLHYDAARTRGHAIATELARDIEVGIERLASHIAALMDAAAAQLADGPPSSDLVTMLQQRAGSGSPVFQRVEIHTLDGRPIARIPAEPIGFPSAPGSSKPVLADHTMRVVQAWGDGNDRAIALARLLVDAAGTPIATMRVEIAADTLVRHDPRPTTDPATTIAVLLSDGTRIAAAPGAASDARGDTTIALSGPDRPALEPGRDVDGDPWILARRNAALGDSGIEIVIGLRGDSFYAAADRRILVFGAIAAILSVLLFTVGRRLQRDRDIHAIGSRDLAIAAGSIEAIDACIAVVERSPEGNDRVVAVNSGFPALLGRPSDDL